MRRQLREVRLLEARADALAADVAGAEAAFDSSDTAAAALDKATGIYREERRAYRLLKRQAILGRGERALQMLVRHAASAASTSVSFVQHALLCGHLHKVKASYCTRHC